MLRNVLLLAGLFLFSFCTKEEEPVIEELEQFSLLEPANQAEELDLSLLLKWSSAAQTVSYKIKISLNSDLSNPLIEESGIKDTVFVVDSELLPLTRYYWSVTALQAENNSEKQTASGIFSFTTKYEKPRPTPHVSKYFVGPNGSDNGASGTAIQPFKTIAYAAKFIPENENDTLFVLAGEYLENEPILLPPGVNLIGENTENVIIKSDGIEVPGINSDEQLKKTHRSALIQLPSDNGVAKGNQELAFFTINGKNKSLSAGIWVQNRSDISLHDINVKYTNLRGVVVATSSKLWYTEPAQYLTGIKIYNLFFKNCGKDLSSETLGNLNIGQLAGAEIHDITIEDSEGYGIKFMWDGFFKNCCIYNIKTTLSESDKLWGEDISIELWNLGPGNEVFNVESNTWLSIVNHPNIFGNKGDGLNMRLHDVKIIDKDGVSNKEGFEIGLPHAEISDCYIENKGMGIAVWNMGRENITIRNNIFSNTNYQVNWAGGAAVYIDNSQSWAFNKINIYNNVFDRHVYGVRIKGANLGTFNIKNNLFIQQKTKECLAEGGTINFGHNFLHTAQAKDWQLQGVSNKYNNQQRNAKIVSTGNKWEDFYKPAAGSPLINAGEDVGISFIGSAPDIGFYELNE